MEAEPSVRQVGEGHGGLPRRDEGVQGAAQDRRPLQLHAFPRHRRPQGSACWQRPHGWSEAWWRVGVLTDAKRKETFALLQFV